MIAVEKDEARFWAKVGLPNADGCMEWMGHRTNGYGSFWLEGKNVRVHRVSYELCVGPIPEGLQIDHKCRNRACVRPDHLEPVTSRENIRRGVIARKGAIREVVKKTPKVQPTIDTLWDFSASEGSCLLWTRGTSGGVSGNRYGSFYINKTLHYVHREVYRQAHGEVPEGMVVKQMCGNRRCMKLDHLEVVTLSTKAIISPGGMGRANRSKTHCPQGHPYDIHDRQGARRCSICRRAQKAASTTRNK